MGVDILYGVITISDKMTEQNKQFNKKQLIEEYRKQLGI
jgi:hypothetical protein